MFNVVFLNSSNTVFSRRGKCTFWRCSRAPNGNLIITWIARVMLRGMNQLNLSMTIGNKKLFKIFITAINYVFVDIPSQGFCEIITVLFYLQLFSWIWYYLRLLLINYHKIKTVNLFNLFFCLFCLFFVSAWRWWSFLLVCLFCHQTRSHANSTKEMRS